MDGALENRWGESSGTDICDYDDDDYDDKATNSDNSYICIFVMACGVGQNWVFLGWERGAPGNIPFRFCFVLSSCLPFSLSTILTTTELTTNRQLKTHW